nr:uncharacterized protein LOC129153187 [Nothobranchius furzeri]XP_054596249.1 uncharacterized protein LOC107392893 [Nothobranchius furzeri]
MRAAASLRARCGSLTARVAAFLCARFLILLARLLGVLALWRRGRIKVPETEQLNFQFESRISYQETIFLISEYYFILLLSKLVMLALKMSALFQIHSVLLQIFVFALRFNLLTLVLSSHVTTFSLHGSKLLPQVCPLLSRILSALAQNLEVQSPSNRSANRKTCGTGREQTSLGCARFDALWIFLCGCRICALTAWLIPALIWSESFTCTSKMDQNQQDAQTGSIREVTRNLMDLLNAHLQAEGPQQTPTVPQRTTPATTP